MKKRPADQEPFMPPDQFGKLLTGLTVNLLVTDMARAVQFATEVLQATVRYSDPDITIVIKDSLQWMLHSDHTYDNHPLLPYIQAANLRGAGVEIRLHRGDPDQAARTARDLGFVVFDGPRDQPDHGLREVHLLDQDGYVWVVDQPLR